jgi:aspartyl-tRNA(Asn)/glutamyl-tRNA(Gln) amidotransferase subunit C
MALTLTDIDRIAHLARLALEDGERQPCWSAERILRPRRGHARRRHHRRRALAHPLAAVQDVQLRLREDVASERDQRQANQQSAPAVEDGLFLVPKVIE